MCGRYATSRTPATLVDDFEADLGDLFEDTGADYNLAPTKLAPLVVQRTDEDTVRRELVTAKWGLVPSWAKDPSIGNRLINARADGLADKPSFRDSFKRRRCLIPADGFYEWQKVGSRKQPWLLRMASGAPFAFAGLWSSWTDPATREPLETCAIVTTEPNALAATVHDRMPVILPAPACETWIDARSDRDHLLALLVPFPAAAMEAFPVSTRVNNPANDDPGCVERID